MYFLKGKLNKHLIKDKVLFLGQFYNLNQKL